MCKSSTLSCLATVILAWASWKHSNTWLLHYSIAETPVPWRYSYASCFLQLYVNVRYWHCHHFFTVLAFVPAILCIASKLGMKEFSAFCFICMQLFDPLSITVIMHLTGGQYGVNARWCHMSRNLHHCNIPEHDARRLEAWWSILLTFATLSGCPTSFYSF